MTIYNYRQCPFYREVWGLRIFADNRTRDSQKTRKVTFRQNIGVWSQGWAYRWAEQHLDFHIMICQDFTCCSHCHIIDTFASGVVSESWQKLGLRYLNFHQVLITIVATKYDKQKQQHYLIWGFLIMHLKVIFIVKKSIMGKIVSWTKTLNVYFKTCKSTHI